MADYFYAREIPRKWQGEVLTRCFLTEFPESTELSGKTFLTPPSLMKITADGRERATFHLRLVV